MFQRQVGGQMAVWKRSLASPRLHSAVGSSPNYDASTGCSASLCTPLHCLVCAGRAGRAAPCGPPKDPQVVPGRPHCKSYKGLSSFHLFFGTGQPWMVADASTARGSHTSLKPRGATNLRGWRCAAVAVSAAGAGAPCDGVLRNGRGGIYCGRRQL